MLGRGGRREGAGGPAGSVNEGDGGLLHGEEEEPEDGDDAVEGEGAGLLPMNPEKTLAMVVDL
jgi:hypothetical protein